MEAKGLKVGIAKTKGLSEIYRQNLPGVLNG